MAVFCIPQKYISALKESAIKGKVDIAKLYDMTSKQRRDFFAEFTNKDVGTFLNKEFEKAMTSNKADALLEWAKSAYDPKLARSPQFKGITDKIKKLEERGALEDQGMLEDLVADTLGGSVSVEETKEI